MRTALVVVVVALAAAPALAQNPNLKQPVASPDASALTLVKNDDANRKRIEQTLQRLQNK